MLHVHNRKHPYSHYEKNRFFVSMYEIYIPIGGICVSTRGDRGGGIAVVQLVSVKFQKKCSEMLQNSCLGNLNRLKINF